MKKLDEPEIRESFVCPNVPEAEGVYVVTDADGHVLYVGRSSGLRRRTAYLLGNLYDSDSGGYLEEASELLLALQAKGETAIVHYLQCSDSAERERASKAKKQPPWNKKLSRNIDGDYCGPFHAHLQDSTAKVICLVHVY